MKHKFSKIILHASLLFLSGIESAFADWRIEPYFNTGIAYNDNLFLDVSGSEESDTIFYVTPGIRLDGVGKHARLQFEYQLQSVHLQKNDDADEVYHRLNLIGNTALAPGYLYLDVNAEQTQRSITPEITVPLDGLSVIGNQENVAILSLAPYIHRQFANDLVFDLRYSYNKVNYESGSSPDSTNENTTLEFGTVPQSSRLDWMLVANQNETEADDGLDWKYQRVGINFGYNQTTTWSYILAGGYEKNIIRNSNITDQGSFWNAGFSWRPSQRLSVRATGGERYYGNAYEFDLNYQARRWRWSIQYDENFETSSTELVGGDDSATPPTGQTGTSTGIYLLKELNLSATRQFAKTALNINIYNTDRDFLFSSDGQPITEDEYTKGGDISWEWNMTRRNTLTITGSSQTFRYRGSSQKDKLEIGELTWARRLSRAGLLEFIYRNANRTSNVAGDEYKQQLLSMNYTHDF